MTSESEGLHKTSSSDEKAALAGTQETTASPMDPGRRAAAPARNAGDNNLSFVCSMRLVGQGSPSPHPALVNYGLSNAQCLHVFDQCRQLQNGVSIESVKRKRDVGYIVGSVLICGVFGACLAVSIKRRGEKKRQTLEAKFRIGKYLEEVVNPSMRTQKIRLRWSTRSSDENVLEICLHAINNPNLPNNGILH